MRGTFYWASWSACAALGYVLLCGILDANRWPQ